MSSAKILIVEDEIELAEVLEYNLRKEGYEVSDRLRRSERLPADRGSGPARNRWAVLGAALAMALSVALFMAVKP